MTNAVVEKRGPIPVATDMGLGEVQDIGLGFGKTSCCPRILDLNAVYRGRDWTDTEKQHVENCVFCQSWIKKFESTQDEPDAPNSILALLEGIGAVERQADYGLPSGKRSNTFVNVSKLCGSEEHMQRVAVSFARLFSHVLFDVIVANSWPMAMIARRLVSHCTDDGQRDVIRVVICEDEGRLMFKEDILPGEKVLVLVDTVSTGHQLRRLRNGIGEFRAELVGVGAVWTPHPSPCERDSDVRWLCEVEMELRDSPQNEAPLFGAVCRKEFHPVSHCMATHADEEFSLSKFLEANSAVREMWETIHEAKCYEPHHVDAWKESENETRYAHHTCFINTMKLLKHEEIGRRTLSRLWRLVEARFPFPEVLLVPKRLRQKRSVVFAGKMRDTIKQSDPDSDPLIVYAQRDSRGNWNLAPKDREMIAGKAVLVLDVAVGHGTTLDSLAQLARCAYASGVGGAVLVSRLSENGEKAFDDLLDYGFCRVYNLPVRPVVVRGSGPSICQECNRDRWIKEFERRYEMTLQPRGGPPRKRDNQPQANKEAKPVEATLFWRPADPFFARCGGAIASGVVLHALHATREGNMGQLEIPELFDAGVPWQIRAAMVTHIPPKAIGSRWSGPLERDIRDFLKGSGRRWLGTWIRAGEVLAKAGRTDWVAFIGNLLQRRDLVNNTGLWAKVRYLAYLTEQVAKDRVDTKERMLAGFEQVLSSIPCSLLKPGLEWVYNDIESAA